MPSLNSLIRGGGVWAGTLQDTASLAASAAGTTQADAAKVTADMTAFTTVALNSGAVLPVATHPGESYYVLNAGANALSLYPPVGDKLNAAATNAAVSVAVGKAARAVYCGSLQWMVVVSA
jgi:hypothetical protein